MPITPIHSAFSISIYFLISKISPIEFVLINCIILLLADLIDIDHFFYGKIYAERRNPFKTRPLHKHWKILVGIAIIMLPFQHLSFLGLGIISHFTLDYIYTKYYLKMKI